MMKNLVLYIFTLFISSLMCAKATVNYISDNLHALIKAEYNNRTNFNNSPDRNVNLTYEIFSLGEEEEEEEEEELGEGCWEKIAAGRHHILAIKEDGTLWGWGEGKFGKLGSTGSTYHNPLPIQIGTDNDWVAVAAGREHSLGIKEDGSLWSWGYNYRGQLGLGNNSSTDIPTQIGTNTDWVKISAGKDHSGAIKTDGTLWTWGRNYYGQLGLGDGVPNQNIPQQVGEDSNWKEISFTVESSLAVKTDGTRWGWGQNNTAQLGLGYYEQAVNSPTQGDTDNDWIYVYGGKNRSSAAMKEDGTVWVWGEFISSSPSSWGDNQSFIDVAAGNTETFIAIKSDGTRWGSGKTLNGELGNGTSGYGTTLEEAEQLDSYTDWSQVIMGVSCGIGMRGENKLFSWGKNTWGELGNETEIGENGLNPEEINCPEIEYYEVTTMASPTDGGTTTGGGSYAHGSSATLVAEPNTGYTFSDWTEDGTVVSSNSSYTFTVLGDRSLVANFTLNDYTITASSSPTDGGTTTGGGSYAHGTSATLVASPNTGYTFSDWMEDGAVVSSDPSYTFTVLGDRSLVANFTLNDYTITASSSPTDGGTTTGGGSYEHGSSATLVAEPNTGYTFSDWTEDGTVVSSDPSYTFTVLGDRSLVANFTINNYTITASSNPTDGGTTSGDGSYTHGATATLVASPNTGYTFSDWMEDGAVVSSNSSYTFTVLGDRSLVANFELVIAVQEFEIYKSTIYPNPFNNVINFKIDNGLIEKIKFYDMAGRLIQEHQINGAIESQINTSALRVGAYLLEIYTSDGIKTFKAIKK